MIFYDSRCNGHVICVLYANIRTRQLCIFDLFFDRQFVLPDFILIAKVLLKISISWWVVMEMMGWIDLRVRAKNTLGIKSDN